MENERVFVFKHFLLVRTSFVLCVQYRRVCVRGDGSGIQINYSIQGFENELR